jgi:hypothetical protein
MIRTKHGETPHGKLPEELKKRKHAEKIERDVVREDALARAQPFCEEHERREVCTGENTAYAVEKCSP